MKRFETCSIREVWLKVKRCD